ncbi:UNVERIFIED_CONTAM: hypothetical protein Sindi_1455000 [Sesamum indicum]
METQLRRPITQMEVFEKVYKKKDNQWSGPRAEEVVEMLLRMIEERYKAIKSLHCPLKAPWPRTSSRSRCQQWVAGRGAEYLVSALRPTTQLLDHHKRRSRLLPHPSTTARAPNIDDQLLALEHYIRCVNPNWPDYSAPEPPVDPSAFNDDDEHTVVGENNLD